MNILIVYAHHEPTSFTAALKNMAIGVLENQKHNVVVSDLYAQGFSAVAQKWDFVTTAGGHFNYALEQKHAAGLQDAFSPDIVSEIQKLKEADVVLFVAPIWWLNVPAILQGWFDRVLAMGVAWDSGRIYENGLLRGKQAMMIASAGQPAEYYMPSGRYKATPAQALHHIDYGTLAFCGFNVHEPFVALNMLKAVYEERSKALKDLEFRLNNLVASPQWLTFYG